MCTNLQNTKQDMLLLPSQYYNTIFQNFLNSLESTDISVSTHPCPCSSFGFALLGISKGRPVRDINMLRGPNGSPPLLECHVQGTSLLLFSHPRQLTQPLGVPSRVHPPHAGQTGRLPNSITSHSTYKRTSKGIGRNLDLSCESVKFFKRPRIVSSFRLCSSAALTCPAVNKEVLLSWSNTDQNI